MTEERSVTILRTERLRLREPTLEDAEFIHELVNDADWLRFIGDRGVSTLDDARRYLRDGPLASYARHGFGLWCVELIATDEALGICGLLRRDTLPDVDVGFAFTDCHRSSRSPPRTTSFEGNHQNSAMYRARANSPR